MARRVKLKDVKDLRIGFRFRYPKWRNVWEVKEIVKRGAIVDGFDAGGGHFHLLEWEDEIEPV